MTHDIADLIADLRGICSQLSARFEETDQELATLRLAARDIGAYAYRLAAENARLRAELTARVERTA